MRAWFHSLWRFQPVSLPQEMKAAYWSGPQTARIKFDTAEDFPTREEAQERLAAAEIMAEIRAAASRND